MFHKSYHESQKGFTLVEIIVSTGIFVFVVSAMLVLFNYTLQINRRVQALREVVQSSRAFTETITREIRNGRIDYQSTFQECDSQNYAQPDNQSLAIITESGDRLCFFIEAGTADFRLKRQSSISVSDSLVFESKGFELLPNTFRFNVTPPTDPNPITPPYPELQPFVTIIGEFQIAGIGAQPTKLPYQTTISTDVYDIYNQN